MSIIKTILIFSDLEGTILREEDGQYDETEMQKFLAQIDKMQQLTGAQVKIHLVSPVFKDVMKIFMDKMDYSIFKYNIKNNPLRRILPLEGGAAYPETQFIEQSGSSTYLKDVRIAELRKPRDSSDYDLATYGKENYVMSWYELYEKREDRDLLLAIYMGNGRNDFKAIDYLKSKRQGLIICPANSRRQIKVKAFNVGNERDLPGLTEGLSKINEKIFLRTQNKADQKGRQFNEENEER